MKFFLNQNDNSISIAKIFLSMLTLVDLLVFLEARQTRKLSPEHKIEGKIR